MKRIPIKKFVPYWKETRKITGEYYAKIAKLESKMAKNLGNDKLEFFRVDGEIVGIGTTDRKMKLLHDSQLDAAANS